VSSMRKNQGLLLIIACVALVIFSTIVGLRSFRKSSKIPSRASREVETTPLAVVGDTLAQASDSFPELPDSEVYEKNSKDFLSDQPISVVESPLSFFQQQLSIGIADIQEEPDPMEKEEKMLRWIEEIALEDISSAIDFLRESEISDPVGRDLEVRLVRAWVKQDPVAASTWVNRHPHAGQQKELVKAVAIQWSNQDFWSAIQWVSELEDDDEWALAQRSLSYEAVRMDPITALTLAGDLEPDQARDNLVVHAAGEWAIEDPEAARAWAMQIENEGLRDRVLSTVAKSMGSSDPIAAATLAVNALAPGRLQNDTILSITQQWSRNDPESVWNWIKYFPSGELRQTALENLVQQQLDYDLPTTYSWINTLAPGKNRVELIAIYRELLKRKSGAYILNAMH